MKIFQPKKPATLERLEDLKDFPVIVQPKIDGIRCVILNGKVISAIKNKETRGRLRTMFPVFSIYDGIVVGELTLQNDDSASFQEIQSALMPEEGDPDFLYTVFETNPSRNFKVPPCCHLKPIPWWWAVNLDSLRFLEEYLIRCNYEGIIIGKPSCIHEDGRCVLKEDYFFKYERFEDAEAVILDCFCFSINNMLASFQVKGLNGTFKDKVFFVASGFSLEQKRIFWEQRKQLKNSVIIYKYPKTREDVLFCPIFKKFHSNEE